MPSALSKRYSATTSATLDLDSQPETCHKIQKPGDQEDLEEFPDLWDASNPALQMIKVIPKVDVAK
jgi:hypothetical protein